MSDLRIHPSSPRALLVVLRGLSDRERKRERPPEKEEGNTYDPIGLDGETQWRVVWKEGGM